MNTSELKQKRESLVKTMQNILNLAKGENRELTKDEQRDFDGIVRKVDDIDETFAAHERIGSLKDGLDNPVKFGESRHGERTEENGEFRALNPNESFEGYIRKRHGLGEERLSIGKAVRGMLLGDWSGAETERRSMSESTGGLGGWLVNHELSGRIIDLARAKTALVRAGARTLPMDAPEITVVKVTSDPTAYWRAENAAITESDMGFAPVKLKAVALGCLSRVSLELLEDARAFATTVEDAISSALALELDRVGLLGTGVGEPRGLWNTDGVNEYSMGDNGAAPSNYDPFSYAVDYVANANGEAKAAIYAPRTAGELDRLKDSQNQPLTPPQSFQRLTKFTTNQVPINQTQGSSTDASTAFVGDFSQLLIGMRTQIVLEATRVGGSDTFAKMQALIRGYLRADIAVLRPNHFTLIKGIR